MIAKFKIIETMRDFRVKTLVPSLKTKKNFFGWPECYKDFNDMIWVNVDSWGRPDYPSDHISWMSSTATFDTLDEAKAFVEKIKREKIEIEL